MFINKNNFSEWYSNNTMFVNTSNSRVVTYFKVNKNTPTGFCRNIMFKLLKRI